MTSTQAQMVTAPAPSPLLFSRWVVRRWIVFVIAGIGYLANVLSTRHLTLFHFLLLTVTYGAWLVIFSMAKPLQAPRPLWWFVALASVASASQFLSLSGTDLTWLPILPTTTACLMAGITRRYLSLIAAAVLWLSSSLAFVLIMNRFDLDAQLILLLSFGSFFGVSVIIDELILAHVALADSNVRLAVAHSKLQEYSAQVEEIAAIRERNRIAREIHDTLGHSLTLLSIQLETATQFEARGDPGLQAELLEARRVARACLSDVRHSVETLRPDDTPSGLLPERLQRLVAGFASASRETAISLDVEEATHPLDPEVSAALYRCAQEALTNIRKHARATKVLLRLSTSDAPENRVELTVLDNGQGSSSGDAGRAAGFGLVGMRERVALLDGTLRAGPEPGYGWRVEVVIPLQEQRLAKAMVSTVAAHQTRHE